MEYGLRKGAVENEREEQYWQVRSKAVSAQCGGVGIVGSGVVKDVLAQNQLEGKRVIHCGKI
jgi:hypothetical protein